MKRCVVSERVFVLFTDFVWGVHILQEMGPDALRETVLQYFALGGSRVQVWI